ncbi:MAG: S-layer homology domain-containing protein [Clostridia bacterium]|nr:S-layer homology domain-containing protein [Clostridia bacterium]
MKKKILTTFLSAAMFFGMFTAYVSAEEIADYTKAETLCIGLGCISEEEYQRDKTVTRGEFAKIISDLCGFDTDTSDEDWNNSTYGEDKDSELTVINENNGYFDDVDKSHPYYNEIMAVYGASYMKGISERRFAPEYDITVLEASKVIIDMLGYAKPAELGGGYPTGYEKIAASTGLINGVRNDFRSVATQGDVICIIYNALNLNIMEFTLSNEAEFKESEKTFMEGVLKTYKIKGTVTDNGITAVNSETTLRKNEIMVAGVTAVLPERLESYRKLIGRIVELYYTYDEDDGVNVVKYMALSKQDNTITFDVDDYLSYENGKISYTQDKRTVTKNLSVSAELIYNNKHMRVYDKSVFDFESGDITLCATDGKEYDLIIINDYEFAYVSGKNQNELLIYNGLKKNSDAGVNIIKLTDDIYGDFIIIQDEVGNKLTYDDIAVGDVLNMLRCDDGIEITVSRNKISNFIVSSKSKNDFGRYVISNDTGEYEILRSYFDMSDAKNVALGNTYTLYLNKDLRVVWIEEGGETGAQLGILTKVKYDEEEAVEPLRILKIYTSDGEIKMYNAVEKISVNNTKMKFKNDATLDFLEENYGNPIMYEINQAGEITSITTPADYGDDNNKNRGWHRINPAGEYSYGANGNDFGRFFYYVSGKTKVFTVPENVEDYSDKDNFSTGLASFSDNSSYSAEGFSTLPNAVEADVIVLRQEATSGGNVNTTSALLIQSVSEGITNDDEPIMIIKGYMMSLYSTSAELVELQVDPKAIMISVGSPGTQTDPNGDVNVVGPRTPNELEPGDAIRYSTNAKGMVDCIRIAYDYNTQKSFNAGSGTDDNFAQGSTYSGYVISKEGNGIRIATNKKPEDINYSNTSDVINTVKAFRTGGHPILVVEKNGKKINIRTGTADDIVSYNDSRSVGEYDRAVVFTYYTSATYGTVIYK